jgi:hypothetical protein
MSEGLEGPCGIAYCYDEKIISETSVAWVTYLAMIAQRLAGTQHSVLCRILEDN